METKFFLTSKTILGAIIALLTFFNITLPFTSEEAEPVLLHIQELIAFILVVWGRIKAEKPLGFRLWQ